MSSQHPRIRGKPLEARACVGKKRSTGDQGWWLRGGRFFVRAQPTGTAHWRWRCRHVQVQTKWLVRVAGSLPPGSRRPRAWLRQGREGQRAWLRRWGVAARGCGQCRSCITAQVMSHLWAPRATGMLHGVACVSKHQAGRRPGRSFPEAATGPLGFDSFSLATVGRQILVQSGRAQLIGSTLQKGRSLHVSTRGKPEQDPGRRRAEGLLPGEARSASSGFTCNAM